MDTGYLELVNFKTMAAQRLTFYEFFAGGGMARIGLGSRWTCTFANEWCDKNAGAYRAHFGESSELKIDDVANLIPNDLPGTPNPVWASFLVKTCRLPATVQASRANEAAHSSHFGS